jgi:hypothetical protein
MTRQFNNQPQNNSRPSSRNIPSSNGYREEQSSNPARPRLNRAVLDRGWENGTTRHHADYRPRVNNGQAPHNNWRKNQEAGNSPYNGPTGNRTNGNRQAQRSEPSSQSYPVPRNRPFNEPHSYNNHQTQTNQRQPQGHGSNFGAQEHSQGRSNDYGNKRSQPNREPSHGYGNKRSQPNREPSHGYGNNRPQRNPERQNYRSFNERSTNDNQEQREPHPRLLSRPATFQRGQEDRRPKETQRPAPYREHFKSNYEGGYDTPDQAASVVRPPFRSRRPDRYEPPSNSHGHKRHRKNAEFRARINEDAEGLINPVGSSQREHSKAHEETASLSEITTENTGKAHEEIVSLPKMTTEHNENLLPNKQAKSATNARKTRKADVSLSPSKGPRPSQRGHKWPQP